MTDYAVNRLYRRLLTIPKSQEDDYNTLAMGAVQCASRIIVAYLKDHPSASKRTVLAAAASLAYSVFGLNEEWGTPDSEDWLGSAGIDDPTKKDKSRFLDYQFDMLKREDYDMCREEISQRGGRFYSKRRSTKK